MKQETLNIFGEYATDELDQWLQDVLNEQQTHKILAFVGPGGSGKTEMACKLLRLLDIDSSQLVAQQSKNMLDNQMWNNSVIVIDNLEKWDADYLISRTQPVTVTRRNRAQFINCNIVVTSTVMPTRLDLLDRCLIVETKRHAPI